MLTRELLRAVREITGRGRVWAGIGAYRLPVDAVVERIELARSLDIGGTVLFSYDSLAQLPAGPAQVSRIGRDAFESRGFYDKAVSTVRFAQKTAIAWRRPIFVCVGATTVSAGAAAGCATPLVNPVTGQDLLATAPGGVTLAGSGFSFDGGGRPNPNSQVTIAVNSTIAGDPPRSIVVEAETGYVHP